MPALSMNRSPRRSNTSSDGCPSQTLETTDSRVSAFDTSSSPATVTTATPGCSLLGLDVQLGRLVQVCHWIPTIAVSSLCSLAGNARARLATS